MFSYFKHAGQVYRPSSMSIVSGKRKLSEKSPLQSVAVKQKRTSEQSSDIKTVKTLTDEEYAKLKQFLKEKKKLLKVSLNYA